MNLKKDEKFSICLTISPIRSTIGLKYLKYLPMCLLQLNLQVCTLIKNY